MKMMTIIELRALDAELLKAKIVELRRQLLEARLSAVTQHMPHYASLKNNLRTSIARALTVQRERL